MSMTREQIFRHLQVIHSGEPGWEESSAALLAEGEHVVPYLIEVMEAEQEKVKGAVVLGYNKLLRLAHCLALFRHPDSLMTFLTLAPTIAHPTASSQVARLFREVLGTVGRRASPDDIQSLCVLMQHARPRWTGTALTVAFAPRETLLIATTLVSIAERAPRPELREALALLKPHPLLPWELLGLHKRLRAALPDENLPIPATSQPIQDLPIPLESEPQ